MRFFSIYSHVERHTPPTQDEMDAMSKLIGEAMHEGWLVTTEGCLPTALGARVRRERDTITVEDGPVAAGKEVVGGFAIINADSKEHAIALTRRFLQATGDGVCELRQLYAAPAVPAP